MDFGVPRCTVSMLPLTSGRGFGSTGAHSEQGIGQLGSWPLWLRVVNSDYPQQPRGGAAQPHLLEVFGALRPRQGHKLLV